MKKGEYFTIITTYALSQIIKNQMECKLLGSQLIQPACVVMKSLWN